MLAVLFFAHQSTSLGVLAGSTIAMVLMVMLLPPAFRTFSRAILPYAPNTEFAFLVIVALLCASVTERLGVYYLVGAFVVGLTEQRLRKLQLALATEKLLRAVEMFASFFIPFYFFETGLSLRAENFSLPAVELAAIFLVAALPARVLGVALHRRLALGESFRAAARFGTSLLPTLVFTMVLAEILRERFAAAPALVSALIIYALADTLIPGLLLRSPVPDYDSPRLSRPTEVV